MRPAKELPTTRIILEIPDASNLDGLIGGFVGAVNVLANAIAKPGTSLAEALRSGGGNNTEVLTAINNLSRKVEEGIMALKDDFNTLQGKFDTMESSVTAVAEDIAALKNELKDANDRANIDLSPLIARADSIESGLRAAVGAGPGSDPEAPPAEEPPVGGGDAEGGTGGSGTR